MSMVFKSKQILSATLVIALGAAVAVNWYYRNMQTSDEFLSDTTEQVSGNLGDSLYVGATTVKTENDDTTETVEVSSENYFADAKLKRTQAHDSVIDSIEKIINQDKIDSETKKSLEKKLSDFQQSMKTETDAEKTFQGQVVVSSGDGNTGVSGSIGVVSAPEFDADSLQSNTQGNE